MKLITETFVIVYLLFSSKRTNAHTHTRRYVTLSNWLVCVCVCVCVYMYLLVHAQTRDTYKTHTHARAR